MLKNKLRFICYHIWPHCAAHIRKGFNHNKSGLWPSSQEQSAVWLHSHSIFMLAARGFLSSDHPCKSMSRQFTNQTGICDSWCRCWPRCCCPTEGYKGAGRLQPSTHGAAPVLFKASVSCAWVNTRIQTLSLRQGTQTSEQRSTTEQFVFFLNKQELCVVCWQAALLYTVCGITLLTNENLDSPARHNSQEQSHPLVPG